MPQRKRPHRSLIDRDKNRPLIDRALAMGTPVEQVARKFKFSSSAIRRYRDRMPPQLKAAIAAAALSPKSTDLDALAAEESAGILGNLANQRARLLVTQDSAMEQGERREVASIAGTIHQNIELTARYLGLFASQHVTNNVSLLISEDYLLLRQTLTEALRPFPDARNAVAEALHKLEGDIAGRMLEQANKPAMRLQAPAIEHENEPVG